MTEANGSIDITVRHRPKMMNNLLSGLYIWAHQMSRNDCRIMAPASEHNEAAKATTVSARSNAKAGECFLARALAVDQTPARI